MFSWQNCPPKHKFAHLTSVLHGKKPQNVEKPYNWSVQLNHILVERHTRYKTWSWSRSRSKEAITSLYRTGFHLVMSLELLLYVRDSGFIARIPKIPTLQSRFKKLHIRSYAAFTDSTRASTVFCSFFCLFNFSVVVASRWSLTFLCHFLRLSPS